MRSNQSFGIAFIVRTSRKRNGHVPLYLRISVNATRVEASLKKSIPLALWDNKKGKGKGSNKAAADLNLYLEEIRSKVLTCYREYQVSNNVISAEGIKNLFLGENINEGYTLLNLIEHHNSEAKDDLAWGTLKNYFTTQKYISKFLTLKHKRKDIHLHELKYNFVLEFQHFLKSYKPLDHHRALNNNGIMKHIERFRKMINMAVRMEWIDRDPFQAFQPKKEKFERGYLNEIQLKELEEKIFSVDRLNWARDLFVFSCYTGLAYIDLYNLTPKNLITGFDGEPWIYVKRQKTKRTNHAVRIPLLPRAKKIVEKYKNDKRALASGRLFPISNQVINAYLKEIASLCGFDLLLTFHVARHTFATTVTLTNGVPIESVSRMLGHASISTTQIYAKVIERKVGEDMKDLKRKLECK